MSNLLLTLGGGPAVDLQPTTFEAWLVELLALTLDLEGSPVPFCAIELDGVFFVWSCWALARVN